MRSACRADPERYREVIGHREHEPQLQQSLWVVGNRVFGASGGTVRSCATDTAAGLQPLESIVRSSRRALFVHRTVRVSRGLPGCEPQGDRDGREDMSRRVTLEGGCPDGTAAPRYG